MTALKKLIRLRRQNLDEHRLYVSRIEGRVSQLKHEIDMIHQSLRDEKRVANDSVEGTFAYTHFAENMKKRLERIDGIYQEALLQLDQEKQKFQALFGEVKVLEISETNQQLQAKKELERQEQAEFDETTLRKFNQDK